MGLATHWHPLETEGFLFAETFVNIILIKALVNSSAFLVSKFMFAVDADSDGFVWVWVRLGFCYRVIIG